MGSSELHLLRRLQKVISKWPVDSTRKGRDLGEFLRTSYVHQFKEHAKTNPLHAEAAVNSLERLLNDHHRKLYARKNDYSFSEGLVVKHASVLSSESQSELEERSRTIWERITGKRKHRIGDDISK